MNTSISTGQGIDPRSFSTFDAFYPFYLSEHSNRICRRLHFVGSTLSLVCMAILVITGKPQYFLYGLLCGYGCAWVGHFGFEKNKPASFKRPLYSFMGDWVMYKAINFIAHHAGCLRASGRFAIIFQSPGYAAAAGCGSAAPTRFAGHPPAIHSAPRLPPPHLR
jgi:hypothetical protein